MTTSGHILVVDDEHINRVLLSTNLQQAGHQVTLAQNGAEALNLLDTQSYDVVLLDLIMPGLDGGITFDRIREIQPTMPVILASGYGMNEQVRGILQRGCKGFIQKPFNISKLSQRIRNIIDEAHRN